MRPSATLGEIICFLYVLPAISPTTFENNCQGANSDWPCFKHLCSLLLSQSPCKFLVYFLNEYPYENNADQIQNYCCLDMLVFCLCAGLTSQFLFPNLTYVFTLTTPDRFENDEDQVKVDGDQTDLQHFGINVWILGVVDHSGYCSHLHCL